MSIPNQPVASTSSPSSFCYSSSPPVDTPSAVTFSRTLSSRQTPNRLASSRQVSVAASASANPAKPPTSQLLLPADAPLASCSSHGGKAKAQRRLKNRGPDYQPRPPNAWILYRSAQLKVLKEDEALASKPQSDICTCRLSFPWSGGGSGAGWRGLRWTLAHTAVQAWLACLVPSDGKGPPVRASRAGSFSVSPPLCLRPPGPVALLPTHANALSRTYLPVQPS